MPREIRTNKGPIRKNITLSGLDDFQSQYARYTESIGLGSENVRQTTFSLFEEAIELLLAVPHLGLYHHGLAAFEAADVLIYATSTLNKIDSTLSDAVNANRGDEEINTFAKLEATSRKSLVRTRSKKPDLLDLVNPGVRLSGDVLVEARKLHGLALANDPSKAEMVRTAGKVVLSAAKVITVYHYPIDDVVAAKFGRNIDKYSPTKLGYLAGHDDVMVKKALAEEKKKWDPNLDIKYLYTYVHLSRVLRNMRKTIGDLPMETLLQSPILFRTFTPAVMYETQFIFDRVFQRSQ